MCRARRDLANLSARRPRFTGSSSRVPVIAQQALTYRLFDNRRMTLPNHLYWRDIANLSDALLRLIQNVNRRPCYQEVYESRSPSASQPCLYKSFFRFRTILVIQSMALAPRHHRPPQPSRAIVFNIDLGPRHFADF